MNKYKLVIFDLDGTLLDTTEGILSSIRYTINKFRLPQLPEADLLTFIGPPIPESFSKHYNVSEETLNEMVKTFRNDYSKRTLFQASVYDGIYQLFDFLTQSDIPSAIATYKREDYALSLLKYFGFGKYTDNMYGADPDNKLKKKDIILKSIQTAGITKIDNSVLMIGDTFYDGAAADELGIDFIAVTYGFGFKKGEQIGNINISSYADSPLDIINYLNKNEN